MARLPVTLRDSRGFIWDVQRNGSVSNGSNDAFDGGYRRSGFLDDDGQSVDSVGGRQLLLQDTLPGLALARQIYVPTGGNWARYLDSVTNTSNATVTYTFTIETNLGSDSRTSVLRTSSGDRVLNTADRFIITDDSTNGAAGGDPVVTTYFGDGSRRADSATIQGDDLTFTYDVTLAAGQTASILYFAQQSNTLAEAQSNLAGFQNPSGAFLAGLSAQQLSQIANYNVGSGPGPGPGPAPVPGTQIGTPNRDILFGTNGNDTIDGRGDRDVIFGEGGNDRLDGGSGSDAIFGGAGNDTIIGDGNASQTASDVVRVPSTGQTLALSVTLPDTSDLNEVDILGFISRSVQRSGEFNIVYVVDTSGSMSGTFSGNQSVPDVNGDGRANTLLDGTIVAFEALNNSVLQAGLGTSDVFVVPFDSNASVSYSGPASGNVSGALRAFRSGGGTNFEAALQATIAALNRAGPGENRVFFISDGAGSGSFADEVQTLINPNGLDAEIRALGLGTGANLNQLDLLDDGVANNSAQRVLAPSTLRAGLVGSGVGRNEVARIEIRVDGRLVETILPSQLVDTPLGLRYESTITGLSSVDDDRIDVRLIASDPARTTARVSLDLVNAPGGEGDDTLRGEAGNDTISGNGGDDILIGDAGRDTLNGGRGDDLLVGGRDNDVLSGGSGDDILNGGLGLDRLDGGAGDDIASYSGSRVGIVGNLTTRLVRGGEGNGERLVAIEGLQGGLGNDVLISNNAANVLRAGYGNDRLTGLGGNDGLAGGPGRDVLSGGPGNDKLDGGPGADILDGGPGADAAGYASATAGVRADLLVSRINTGDARGDVYRFIENMIGSSFDDDLRATNGANTIFAGFGDDVVNGRGGNDVIRGQGGDDRIFAGSGNDVVAGGAGADQLSGGQGRDAFVYFSTSESGPGAVDRILDFQRGADRISLAAIDANEIVAGNQAFTYIGGRAFSNRPGELRVGGGQVQGDVDGDGRADLVIIAAAIAPSDFLL